LSALSFGAIHWAMVPIDQIRRLEYAVREAQAALDRAHAENGAAERAWLTMVKQAEANIAAGKSVSAAFITGAAERARRDGADAIAQDRTRDNIRDLTSYKDRPK
jgi:hypothetical protein